MKKSPFGLFLVVLVLTNYQQFKNESSSQCKRLFNMLSLVYLDKLFCNFLTGIVFNSYNFSVSLLNIRFPINKAINSIPNRNKI